MNSKEIGGIGYRSTLYSICVLKSLLAGDHKAVAVKPLGYDKEAIPLCFDHATFLLSTCRIGYYLGNNNVSKLRTISKITCRNLWPPASRIKQTSWLIAWCIGLWSRINSLRGSRDYPKLIGNCSRAVWPNTKFLSESIWESEKSNGLTSGSDIEERTVPCVQIRQSSFVRITKA